MNDTSDLQFRLFSINSGPYAQPAYAICTAFRNEGNYLKSESIVLIQTSPSQARHFGQRNTYSENGDPQGPLVVNEAFVIDDALHLAQSVYSTRARELDPELLHKLGWARPIFDEIPAHQLFGLWAHTPFSAPLLAVAAQTKCKPLKEYLNMLSRLPTVKHTDFQP